MRRKQVFEVIVEVVAALLLSTHANAAQKASPLTPEAVAAAHARAVARSQPVSLKMVHERQDFVGDRRHGPPNKSSPWIWAKREGEERLVFNADTPPAENGLPTGIYEYFVKGSETYLLRNWDRDNPQAISPKSQGTVRAQIYPTTGECPGRDVSRFLLWTFSLGTDLERWTLSDLLRSKDGTELTRTSVEGFACVQLKIPGPDYLDHKWKGNYFVVSLVPERDFNCVQVVEHVEKMPGYVNGKQEVYAVDTTRTVEEWTDCGDGVFIPAVVETEIVAHSSDDRRSVIRTTVSDLAVGDDVSADAFSFTFPEGALVASGPREHPESAKLVVWGKDGPTKTIASLDELLPDGPMRAPSDSGQSAGPSPLVQWVIALNVAFLVGAICFLVFRKGRSSEQ